LVEFVGSGEGEVSLDLELGHVHGGGGRLWAGCCTELECACTPAETEAFEVGRLVVGCGDEKVAWANFSHTGNQKNLKPPL